MTDYELVKTIITLDLRVSQLETALKEAWDTIDYNLKNKKLDEPKEEPTAPEVE